MNGELRMFNNIANSVNRKKLDTWSPYSIGNPSFWLTNHCPMLSNNTNDINAPMANKTNCEENNDFFLFRLSFFPSENDKYLWLVETKEDGIMFPMVTTP